MFATFARRCALALAAATALGSNARADHPHDCEHHHPRPKPKSDWKPPGERPPHWNGGPVPSQQPPPATKPAGTGHHDTAGAGASSIDYPTPSHLPGSASSAAKHSWNGAVGIDRTIVHPSGLAQGRPAKVFNGPKGLVDRPIHHQFGSAIGQPTGGKGFNPHPGRWHGQINHTHHHGVGGVSSINNVFGGGGVAGTINIRGRQGIAGASSAVNGRFGGAAAGLRPALPLVNRPAGGVRTARPAFAR